MSNPAGFACLRWFSEFLDFSPFRSHLLFFGLQVLLALFSKPLYFLYETSLRDHQSARRQVALRRLGQIGPFLEGSLCSFQRPGCSAPGWHLTFKVKAKTRTVYVPMDLVSEVKEWNRTYRQLKKLIREVSRHSLAIIHRHVANQRAASRSRALTRR